MTALDAVFKAYDVRGTVPDQLDGRSCRAIGWAFARFAGTSRILVARDMRESGVELAGEFATGARRAGATVIDLGLASTDMMYFASGRLDAPGAMFTASHNPAAYNGIKMCLAGAKPVGSGHRAGRDPRRGAGGHRLRCRQRARDGGLRTTRAARGVRRARPLLHRPLGPASPEGRRRHRQRHGWPRRPQGLRGPPGRARGPLRRARRQLPQPSRRPHPGGEPPGPEERRPRLACRYRARLRRGRGPGLPRRREGAAGVGIAHHRTRGPRHAREAPRGDGPLQPHLLQGGARDHRAIRRDGGAHPRRPLLHQAGHGRHRGRLRR